MTSAYEQYGVPMVSCYFIHFQFELVLSFCVLCLGCTCSPEGCLLQSCLQSVWLHLENLNIRLQPPVLHASCLHVLYLHKIAQRCNRYNGFVTVQTCCQWVSCSNSKNVWNCQWQVWFSMRLAIGGKWHLENWPWLEWCGILRGAMHVGTGYQQGWMHLLILELSKISFFKDKLNLSIGSSLSS